MGVNGGSKDKPSESRESRYVGYGVGFGLLAGAVIGFFTDNSMYLGVGLLVGICVGALAAHVRGL